MSKESSSLQKDQHKRLRIVHLTSVHNVFDTRIFHRQCRYLVECGFHVSLIGVHDTDFQIVNGVKIIGIPKPKNRLQRIFKTTWKVYRAGLKENGDIYQFHDVELIPLGILLRLLGKKVIYDAHEDVPKDVISKQWIPTAVRPVLSSILNILEILSGRILSAIVAATPAIALRFRSSKVSVVQNFPRVNEFDATVTGNYIDRPAYMIYVGDITVVRGINELVQALGHLHKDSPVKLLLVGQFNPPKLLNEVSKLPGWERVIYLGWKNREQVAQLLGVARAGICTFHPVPNHIEAQPNKLFEYMSSGIPVIASDFPLWRGILDGGKAGILVNPRSILQMSRAIQWILDNPEEAENMGVNGKNRVLRQYNWALEAGNLVELYRVVLER